MMVANTKQLPQCIIDEIEEHRLAIEKLHSLADITSKLEAYIGEHFQGDFNYVSVSGKFTACVTVWLQNATRPEVASLLRFLAHNGYRQSRGCLPHPTIGSVGWKCGLVEIENCLSGNGDTCRFVQVGEKTEPVYELQCGGAG